MPLYPSTFSDKRITLCHDWLTGMRGGERVLELFCDWFPHAPLHTLIHNRTAVSDTINSHAITTSLLQHMPGIFQHYRYYLPVMPAVVSRMPRISGDLLISTSHCIAKGVPITPDTRHLCYCFTPMRYAWTFYDEYFGGSGWKRSAAKMVLPRLQAWDKETSQQVTRFVAISKHIQKRIRDFYGRDADVVYPPVDLSRWTLGGDKRQNFALIVSALVPYKKIDLAVNVFNRLGWPLKIVGTGTGMDSLRAQARSNVEILGWQPDETIRQLYQTCGMLIFPGEEDFGLVPIEAQACGAPVVAFRKGGAMESVTDHVSGVFFDEQTDDSLAEAVERCRATAWDSVRIRQSVERFGIPTFVEQISKSILACLDSPRPR